VSNRQMGPATGRGPPLVRQGIEPGGQLPDLPLPLCQPAGPAWENIGLP
jgi:hypothetical protein